MIPPLSIIRTPSLLHRCLGLPRLKWGMRRRVRAVSYVRPIITLCMHTPESLCARSKGVQNSGRVCNDARIPAAPWAAEAPLRNQSDVLGASRKAVGASCKQPPRYFSCEVFRGSCREVERVRGEGSERSARCREPGNVRVRATKLGAKTTGLEHRGYRCKN
jgi:hypothetical protein